MGIYNTYRIITDDNIVITTESLSTGIKIVEVRVKSGRCPLEGDGSLDTFPFHYVFRIGNNILIDI